MLWVATEVFSSMMQLIKNIAGCRDTRTAKSKETSGMLKHNSEAYNPHRDLLHV